MEAASLDFHPVIRPFWKSDRDFIEATWVRNFAQACSNRPAQRLMVELRERQVVEFLLSMPMTKVAVLAAPEYLEAIIGWAVATGDVLHYVHVKHQFRGQGFMHALLEALGLELPALRYSHQTRKFEEIMRKHPGSRFEPRAALSV